MNDEIETLRRLLHYDPLTGDLFAKKDRGRVKKGRLVGYIEANGYIKISFNARHFWAHRLAWALTHGEWPMHHIDHINGIPADNRLVNLREATRHQNLRNSKRHKDNTSGIKGVTWDKRREKWTAQIWAEGRHVYLGRFDKIEQAGAAYEAAAKRFFGEFARLE